ncbi:hypothetical protein [Sandarakinorhabdus limnophila]|uniref:hypothetical protein n=1 Tax=Sandarakinorhabdus limnophila TaxID=210512 RepID=UPI003138272E
MTTAADAIEAEAARAAAAANFTIFMIIPPNKRNAGQPLTRLNPAQHKERLTRQCAKLNNPFIND